MRFLTVGELTAMLAGQDAERIVRLRLLDIDHEVIAQATPLKYDIAFTQKNSRRLDEATGDVDLLCIDIIADDE